MRNRGQNFKQFPLNIVGSSIFGRYPKVSSEYTYNMFVSDNFLVPYAGYQIAVAESVLGNKGRGLHNSTKFNRIVAVVDNKVYLINVFFDQNSQMSIDTSVIEIGTLNSTEGPVYITENNKPQILISDNVYLYLYDPTLAPNIRPVVGLQFVPGYVDFHDTYFLCAASQDQLYSPAANNTWRLSAQNNGASWPSDAQHVGLIQTKPDNTQAVIRFPSKGNMIFVMGETVTEAWFDTGAQLFPYQRTNQFTIDYGCVSPTTIATNDQMTVWLAQNEKSGPIIMFSDGGMPEKITTDGLDYLFSQLTTPSDSRAFLYRQDGHLFYHINFYTDNKSFYYDFNTKRFYNSCDENLNYFIGNSLCFFNNQYYLLSQNDGNLYAFDTIYPTYSGKEIPRIRTCKNIRLPSQEYYIINDIGFTIETGETDYQREDAGPINLITEDGNFLITEGITINMITEDGNYLLFEDSNNWISEQDDLIDFSYLISEQDEIINFTPRVDLSLSFDGGASFGNDFPYVLNPVGQRRNQLNWWQCGAGNDVVPQFKFWGMGRVVCTDGVANIRQ